MQLGMNTMPLETHPLLFILIYFRR